MRFRNENSSHELSGLTVFITGAARGIGAESAHRLAARGANVALVGLEADALTRVAAHCRAYAMAFECDVTDSDAVRRAAPVGGRAVMVARCAGAANGAETASAPFGPRGEAAQRSGAAGVG